MTISNSAPGLDPAWTAAAFARGWSTKAGGALHGRGLGLALLQQVVARYGGRIDVTNDRGAVFTVRLPLEPVVVEVADVVGISRVTARRYREHLTGRTSPAGRGVTVLPAGPRVPLSLDKPVNRPCGALTALPAPAAPAFREASRSGQRGCWSHGACARPAGRCS